MCQEGGYSLPTVSVIDCKSGPKSLFFAAPTPFAMSSAMASFSDSGLNHITCSSQWGNGKCDVIKSLKSIVQSIWVFFFLVPLPLP